MDRLQAITVCVNYEDLLECIVPNKEHFDRWLIVTHRSDKKTIKVCEKYGLEYIFSKRLYLGGAVFHKAKALNEGLDYLDNDGWVAVIDSDILLPANFRERLDALKLNWRTLYGLRGRRVCLDFKEFDILKEKEPWTLIWHSTSVLGYFHLFHFSQPHNRYPEDASKDASAYDVVFSDYFPDNKRKKLPISSLHLGPVIENWKGRKSKKFRARPSSSLDKGLLSGLEQMLGEGTPKSTPKGKVALIGYCSPKEAGILAEFFSEVVLIDEWGLHESHWNEMEDADCKTLANRFDTGTRFIKNIKRIGKHSEESLAKIEDGSLQGIFFGGDMEIRSFSDVLPLWLLKLASNGFIAGSGFGWECFKETTQYITLTIGIPDLVCADGTWLKWVPEGKFGHSSTGVLQPMANGRKRFYPTPLPIRHIDSFSKSFAGSSRRGVLYFVDGTYDIPDLIISLHSLREFWEGPVCVIYRGEDHPAFQVTCNRYGVDLVQMAASKSDGFSDQSRLRVLHRTPFEVTLYLAPTTIILGKIETYFRQLLDRDCLFVSSPDHTKVDRLTNLMRLSNRLDAEEAELADSFLHHPGISLSSLVFKSNGNESGRILHESSVFLASRAEDSGCAQVSETVFQKLLPSMNYYTAAEGLTVFAQSSDDEITPETRIYSHMGGMAARVDPSSGPLIARVEEQVLKTSDACLRKTVDTPIVTVVVPENFADFQRNVWTWKFNDNALIYAVFTGIEDEVWRSCNWPSQVRIHSIESDPLQDAEFNAGRAMLKAIPEVIDEQFFIYINAGCTPKPGAELFLSESWRSYSLVGCGWTNARSPVHSIESLVKDPGLKKKFRHVALLCGIGWVKTELLKSFAFSKGKDLSSSSFDECLTASSILSSERMSTVNPNDWGWKID